MRDDTSRQAQFGAPMNRFARMWLSATEHALDSLVAANRAALTATGLADGHADRQAGTEALAYTDVGWETDRSIAGDGGITVGDRVTFTKRIDEEDVEWFAAASGDTNRLHLDPSFAAESRFGGRIAHGTLVSGLISAALARLPGLTVYLSQDVTFLHPVELGDELRAECEVIEDLGENRYRLTTKVFKTDDTQVIDGEAVVMIDTVPDGGT